jgi:hypothetical protein
MDTNDDTSQACTVTQLFEPRPAAAAPATSEFDLEKLPINIIHDRLRKAHPRST